MGMQLRFEDAYYDQKGFLYFFSFEINGLFRVDLSDNSVEYLLSVNEYAKGAKRLFGTVVNYGDKLYFLPLSADDVLIYDIEKNTYKLIPIEKRNDYKGSNAKFYAATVYEQKVFLFPAHYPAIVELNIFDDSIKYYDQWMEYTQTVIKPGIDFFRQSVCCQDSIAIAPFCFGDSVLLFNMEDGSSSIKSFDTIRKEKQGFSGVYYDGKNYWLTPIKGEEVLRWNYNADTVDSICLSNVESKSGFSFLGGCINGSKLFIKPAYNNSLYILDTENDSVKTYSHDRFGYDDFTSNPLCPVLAFVNVGNGNTIMCLKNGNYCLVSSDYVVNDGVNFDFRHAINSWVKACEKDNMFYENELLGIDSYIGMVENLD